MFIELTEKELPIVKKVLEMALLIKGKEKLEGDEYDIVKRVGRELSIFMKSGGGDLEIYLDEKESIAVMYAFRLVFSLGKLTKKEHKIAHKIYKIMNYRYILLHL